MALPTTITGVTFLDTATQGRSRPYISSSGNVYVVFKDSAVNTDLDIYKATDPTSSFSQIASITLTAAGIVFGIATYQDGDNLHIATQDDNENILYHVFSMSSDTFTTSNEAVTSAVGTNINVDKAISVSLETGGDIIIFYQGASENVSGQKERVNRAWKTGGSWTVNQPVDAGGAVDYFLGGIVRGEVNKFHLVFKDDTNRRAKHRSVQNVDGTLSAVENLVDANSEIEDFTIIQPVYYDASGIERITTGYMDSPEPNFFTVVIEDDGTPETFKVMAAAIAVGEFSTVSFAVDVKTVWSVFRKFAGHLYSTSNVDDSSWTNDELEVTIQPNSITSNIYQRGSDIVLAYIYDDGGVIKYNEKVLRSVGKNPGAHGHRFGFVF